MTESEKRKLEPSPCTKIPKRGYGKIYQGLTRGCNERYERDEVTNRSVGTSISRGFEMMRDDEPYDD